MHRLHTQQSDMSIPTSALHKLLCLLQLAVTALATHCITLHGQHAYLDISALSSQVYAYAYCSQMSVRISDIRVILKHQ